MNGEADSQTKVEAYYSKVAHDTNKVDLLWVY